MPERWRDALEGIKGGQPTERLERAATDTVGAPPSAVAIRDHVIVRDPWMRRFIIVWTVAFTIIFLVLITAGFLLGDYVSCQRQVNPRTLQRTFFLSQAKRADEVADSYFRQEGFSQARQLTDFAVEFKNRGLSARDAAKFQRGLAKRVTIPDCGQFPPPVN